MIARGTPVLATLASNWRKTTSLSDTVTGSSSIGSIWDKRRGQLRKPHSQDHEAFLLADLIRVVSDPHPVRGMLLGPMQLVVPQPQQPKADRREMGDGEVESPIHRHLLHPVQSAAGGAQREPIKDPAHHQEDLHRAELMARRDQLESGIGAQYDHWLGAGGDCSRCSWSLACSSSIVLSRASALARHRSRDRRKSRTS